MIKINPMMVMMISLAQNRTQPKTPPSISPERT